MQAIIAYMVFSGMLLKPGGKAPVHPGAPFVTWQFWAVVGGLVVARAFMYWWDFVRGGEAQVIPPEAVVADPLRRLFVLQFGILAGGLLVYWPLDSGLAGLVCCWWPRPPPTSCWPSSTACARRASRRPWRPAPRRAGPASPGRGSAPGGAAASPR